MTQDGTGGSTLTFHWDVSATHGVKLVELYANDIVLSHRRLGDDATTATGTFEVPALPAHRQRCS